MVEIKEIDESEQEVSDSGDEEVEEDSDEETPLDTDDQTGQEDESDEDVIFLDDMLEDNVDGEFSIGDVILSTGNVEQGWSRADLEEALRQERVAKDWEDSDEFVGGDFYQEAGKSGDFYGGRKSEDDFYKSSGEDFYKSGDRGSGTYETGDLYSGKKDSGEYEAGARNLKSYDEFASGRKGEPSVLESMGFEDGKKDKRRDFRDYSAKS